MSIFFRRGLTSVMNACLAYSSQAFYFYSFMSPFHLTLEQHVKGFKIVTIDVDFFKNNSSHVPPTLEYSVSMGW